MLLPATLEDRLYIALLFTLTLLPGLLWSARQLMRKEAELKPQGTVVLLVVLGVLVGLWWWVLQARIIVAGWHTIVR